MNENITRNNPSGIPLLSSQKRLWTISRLAGNSPAYNLSYTYCLEGKLDTDLFRQSIDILFKRQISVFSTIREIDGNPVIEIKKTPVKINFQDFSEYPDDTGKEKLFSLIIKDKRELFDLNEGPLYRLHLLKLNENRFYFHVTFHHIIFDGISWGVFVDELNLIYGSLVKKKECILPPIELFSHDYAISEQGREDQEKENDLIDFWKKTLKDSPPAIPLPLDSPRKDKPSGLGRNLEIVIPAEIRLKLKKISSCKKFSLFRIMLSALALLFHKYTSEKDICIGTFAANRPKPDMNKIFGMFVDTIPVRFIIDDDQSFNDFLNYSNKAIADAIANKDLPFDRIVEEVKPDRTPYMNPLFQVALSWISVLRKPMNLGDVRGTWVNINKGISRFDITFYFWEKTDVIRGFIQYNTDIFTTKTITRLRDNFIQLLRALDIDPDTKIRQISFTSEEDLNFIGEWNNTEAEYENDLCIHQKFEQQVQKYPEAAALLTNDVKLTYRELNEHANRVANYLIKLNVKTEDRVGICIDRSIEMMICIFGVLKSGAAYLPLSPENPTERLQSIISDAGPKIILTTRASSANIPEGVMSLYIDDIINNPLSDDTSNPDVKVVSNNLAYVLYTSGSTGTPKGVMIEHHSVLNRLGWMQKAYPINQDDVLLQKTPITFDVSVWELFWWSFNGAKLVLLPRGGEKEPETIIDFINRFKVSIIHFVPSMFTAFFAMLKARELFAKLNSLKRIFMSGEALPIKLVREFNDLRVNVTLPEIINLYGPTEATVDVSYYNCPESNIQNVYIGRPIDNTKLFVADKNNNLQPIGVPGELFITGVNLARGYINNPELTNEKFFNFNFGGEEVRAYRTGDLVKLIPEGELDYIGRLDNQVKIRGFRIELGDIEAKILDHPDVSNCSVIISEINEPKSLIAYICLNPEIAKGEDAIRGYLCKKLPDYMVPSYFVFMNTLPLTSSGKLDRKILTGPVREKPGLAIAEPTNNTEKRLLNLWKDLLKTDDISINDNFFDVGGNSLLAINLATLITKDMDITVNTVTVLQYPTIKGQSDYIEEQLVPKPASVNTSIDEKSQRRKSVQFRQNRG